MLRAPRFADDPVLEACAAGTHRMLAPESGPAVTAIQQALIDLGFDLPGGADGAFGGNTGAAVSAYKQLVGLVPDDPVVGQGTMQALDDAFAIEDPARAVGAPITHLPIFAPGDDIRIPGELIVALTAAAHAAVTTAVPVGLLREADNPPTTTGIAEIDDVLANLQVTGITRPYGDMPDLQDAPGVGAELTATYKIRCDPSIDLDAAVTALGQLNSVTAAEPDHYVEPCVSVVPNDPLYPTQQWGLWRIRAPAAWRAGQQGSANVVVAVVDTGIDSAHPDLSPRISGLGRDVFDLAHFPPDHRYAGHPEVTGGPPDDDAGHGTRVASIIAAITNNASGMAGVTWSGSILPIRCMARAEKISTGEITAVGSAQDMRVGVAFAARNGANIVNLSLGSNGGFTSMEQRFFDQIRAFDVLVIAASGNENLDGQTPQTTPFPAAYPSVMAVGATLAFGGRWTETVTGPSGTPITVGSNKGGFLDVVAPGARIMSAHISSGPFGGPPLFDEGTGTSLAAPFVSGVAALIKAEKPAATPSEIRNVIRASADPRPAGSSTDEFGAGTANAAAALARARQVL